MSIRTHGPDCQTWCYATSCWHCGQSIHVLQCTCGSAVLFDQRGSPWPKHSCRGGLAGTSGRGIGGSGLSGWTAVDTLRAAGAPITPDVMRKIFPGETSTDKHGAPRPEITPVEPRPGARWSSTGIVRELHPRTRRLAEIDGYSEIGRKLLGLGLTTTYWQLTLVDNGVRPNESFTALVDSHVASALKRGVIVGADLEARISGGQALWVVTKISVL